MAAMQVSMPSPTISTSLGSARRTAPPRHGPSIIFGGWTRGFACATITHKVSAVNHERRRCRSPRRFVTSATITGQMPPEGVFQAGMEAECRRRWQA